MNTIASVIKVCDQREHCTAQVREETVGHAGG